MRAPPQPGEQAPGAEQAQVPAGVAHVEQVTQQAQLGRYGALASLGQLGLAGLPSPKLAREGLVQLLEALELSQGALLEPVPDGQLRCTASFGVALEPEALLEPVHFGAWRAVLTTPSLGVEVVGGEAPVPLPQLGEGARGLLVRLPGSAGEAAAVLALVTPPERRFDADALGFLRAAAHLLGAALNRQRREAGQREEVARLEALLAHTPLAICLKDAEGRYVYVNPRTAAYLRRPAEALLGRTDAELFPAHVAQLMLAHEDAVRAAGRPLEFEEEVELPEGRVTFLSVRFPLCDAEGRLYATGYAGSDITRVKRIERELRQSEEQLRLLVDGVKDHGVFLLDPEGRVSSWSVGAQRLKGYLPEEILGRPLTVILDPPDAGRVREVLARAAAEGRVEAEAWCVRKDGSRFLSSDTIHPLWTEDGRLRGYSVVTQDITERRRAEEQLRHSETRYRLVARATHEAIWDWDLVGNRLEWGERALALFGYPEDEDASHPGWWEARLHPEDREAVLGGLTALLRGTQEAWSTEYRFLRADGGYAWVRDAGYLLRADGRPVRIIGAMADITRRRRAEEERSRLYRESQAAVRLRDEFLSVASHELKTPLTTLQLHLQMLHVLATKGADVFTPERAQVKLGLAEQQVQRLASLVNELLDVSRLSSGRLELRFDTINVGTLLRELLERQRDALRRSGSEVRLHVHDRRLARVDPMRLEQVLTNLLSNAVKYGEGRPIDITLTGDEASYCIEVRDRGIGIPPEDQSRIFERFERAVSERHYGGLGLGLWITRQIAMSLGGTITVDSRPGQGSTFQVELPRFPLEAGLTALADAPAPA